MNRILIFLEENPLQYCATVGLDGKPKVRPFQMMFSDEDKLIYCTGAKRGLQRACGKFLSINKRINNVELA